MRIVITDLTLATCDLTGKENVECVKLWLDEHSAELLCSTKEFIKLLRLRKKQDSSTNPIERKGTQP